MIASPTYFRQRRGEEVGGGVGAVDLGGVSRSWGAVTGNEGYRVIWGSISRATAQGSITEIAALYANSTDRATDVNSYTFSVAPGTWYWRVAALVNGFPQEWSDEASFTA